MRLVVRDRGPIYCSDKIVKKCLKDLKVRYLNWDRPDMCTDTLRETSDLVQVDLYWSDLKAVLRSWGDINGLRKVKGVSDERARLIEAFLTTIASSRQATR